MQHTVAKVYGIVITVLALLGLSMGDTHLFGVMNADLALDWARVLMAGLLLYAGFGTDDDRFVRGALWTVGIVSVGAGLLGLVDSNLLGLAPTRFTIFDVALHMVSGLFAIAMAAKKETKHGAPVDA